MKKFYILTLKPRPVSAFLRISCVLLIIIQQFTTSCNKKDLENQSNKTASNFSKSKTPATVSSISDSWVAVLDITNDKINVYDCYAASWTDANRKMSWSPTTGKLYSTAEVSAWGDPRDVRIRTSPWGGHGPR